MDKAEGSKGLLLRIVDYKSSEKGLDLAEVYYGLALQMLTYLDLTITYSKEWLGVEATPAGILYFHIHDPLIQAPIPLAEDEIEQEIFKKFKMKGLLLEDVEAVKLMDQTLESGRSQVIQAGLKKDGSFRSDSAVLSEDHFHILTQHVRRTFEEAGERITNGEVAINPYKLKDQTPCRFCSFKSICQFDESIEDNEFRVLSSEKDDVVIDRIKKKGISMQIPKPNNSTWTDDQWEAIVSEGQDILVAAAAGSGKTAVLVERLIRKMTRPEDPVDVDRLLVVTFTNASAAEMKHRITEALEKELAKTPGPFI